MIFDRLACASVPLPAVADALPEWLHIMPIGRWEGHPSGTITITPADCQAMVANFERIGIDVVIDYEHQTIASAHNGKSAPAAGWIDRMEVRSEGLFARVKSWTAKAGDALRAHEYRYLSPVLLRNPRDPRTGKPLGKLVQSVALTNVPFFGDALHPVVNRGDAPMNFLALILAALGLPETTTEEQAVAEVTKLKEGVGEVSAKAEIGAAVCKSLGVNAATAKGRIAKVLAHEGYVTVEEHLAVLRQVEEQKGATTERDGETIAARAVESGKLTPAMKPHFLAYLQKDYAAACAWLDELPVLCAPGRQVGAKPAAEAAKLTADERAIAAKFNLTDAEYLAAKGI